MVAAVLVAGSEKAAAHHLGLSHSTVKHHLANARTKEGVATTAQLVWILAERLPEPDDSGVDPLERLLAVDRVRRPKEAADRRVGRRP